MLMENDQSIQKVGDGDSDQSGETEIATEDLRKTWLGDVQMISVESY